MPPDNPEAFLIGGPLLYIIDGSTAVGVMDGVSSAVRAERLECGVLCVRDLNDKVK